MKTIQTTAARFQTGLIIASATLALLAVADVLPLRASSAVPPGANPMMIAGSRG